MMSGINFNFDLILQNNGYAISLTGIAIVFLTLCITSVFISVLPYAITFFSKVFPEKKHVAATRKTASLETKKVSEENIALAIAIALHRKKTGEQI